MAGVTYLTLVNGVLKRLRIPTVATVTETDYSTMIADLVNQAYRTVQTQSPWIGRHNTYATGTITADGDPTTEHELTFLDTLLTWETRLIWTEKVGDTTPFYLRRLDYEAFERKLQEFPLQTGAPCWFRFSSMDADGDIFCQLHPAWPTGSDFTINMTTLDGGVDLSAGTDIVFGQMSLPIILKAFTLALRERGEDSGVRFDAAMEDYEQAMADAVGANSRNTAANGPEDWVAV